jgi:ATP-dependent DNA helicase RecG
MPTPSRRQREPGNPLRGPIALERRQGFADKAVIGGMAGLLRQWATEAAGGLPEGDLRADLRRLKTRAAKYPDGGLEERRELLAEAERLAALVGDQPPRPPAQRAADLGPAGWHSPLSHLRGIGPARSAELAKAGLHTFGDLLQCYPFRYEDRRFPQAVRQLAHRQTACLEVEVTGPGKVTGKYGDQRATVPATDGSDAVDLVWFHQPYRASQFEAGAKLVVMGQVRLHQGKVALAVSEAEALSGDELNTRRLVPVYSAPPFSQVVTRKLIAAALRECQEFPEERVPGEVTARQGLIPLAEALREIHFPTDSETLKPARARIAYDELFLLQVRLAQRRRRAKTAPDGCALEPGECLAELRQALPFRLTGAQERVAAEILDDLRRPEAASRLIHGDVGAGKTVVAALALLAAARAGGQAVLMAPTELLASQHHRTLTGMLGPLGLEVGLLVGGMDAAGRRPVLAALADGRLPGVVGTHALFQESVGFAGLAVAVIDEQHRFGVRQRALLVGKGLHPNTFIMSATPIPRTLALTAYGDFDVSILDELPPGRRPVCTEVITRQDVRRAYRLVSDAVERGQQAYLVCPLIERNESALQAAAEELFQQLRRGIFPSLKLGLVHGKLPPEERDAVMEQFRRGELEALIATTVVEVGVDVPTATVMVIMDAERFGLAQLHQLRGRVARSRTQAYCALVTGSGNEETIDRLKVLERTTDGFLVAEEDLRRRGPGEMAGLRQSGLPDPRMADLLADTQTLAQARADAFALVEADPSLAQAEHSLLKETLGPEPKGPGWTL